MFVLPVLVALRPVARVEDRIAAGVIEASFVTANLSLLGEHPVLKRSVEKLQDIPVGKKGSSHFIKSLHFSPE